MKYAFYLLLLVSTNAFSAGCYELSVTVNKTQASGKEWDFYGTAPDVKVCFYDEWGMTCKAKGDGSNYKEPYCKDSFVCGLGVIRFSGEKVHVEITDVDPKLVKNTAVAAGDCKVGEKCPLGNAELSFAKVSCESAHNQALQWMAYTPRLLAQCAAHILLRKPALRSGHH